MRKSNIFTELKTLQPKKISIIGNPCTGKTTLSKELSQIFAIPVYHVDSIQFDHDMNLINQDLVRSKLKQISDESQWIIDGHGPLSLIEDRFMKADVVIVIRKNLLLNYLWLLKRYFTLFFTDRPELQANRKKELNWKQFKKVATNIWNTEHGLWPQLDRIFKTEKYKDKKIFVIT